MKKIISLLLIVSIVLAFASCTDLPDTYGTTAPETTTASETTTQTTASETTETATSETTSATTETSAVVTPDIPPEIRRGKYTFDEMKDYQPDYEAADKKTEELREAIKGDDSELVVTLFDELDGLISDMSSASTLMSIKLSTNVNDMVMQKASEQTEEKTNNYHMVLMELGREILNSKHADKMKEEYSEEDIEYIEKTGEYLDSEYVSLQSRNTELFNSYLSLESTVRVNVGGTMMSVDSMLSQYQNGKITYKQALDYYNQFYHNFADAAADIYVKQMEINKRLAEKLGYSSYKEYAYSEVYDRDYSGKESEEIWASVKKYIVPLYTAINSSFSSSEKNKIEYYNSKITNQLTLREDTMKEYFSEVSPEMNVAYDYIKEYGLYISGNSADMEKGAYTTFVYKYDLPVIYQYLFGGINDLTTFIHEFGHFFNYYLLGENATNNIDIAEIHSQTNELLFMDYYKTIYAGAYRVLIKNQLFESLDSLVMASFIDEFETRAYEMKETPTAESLNSLCEELIKEYGIDFSGIQFDGYLYWSLVTHIFRSPFYYISYGISVVPSLEIYLMSLEDRQSGIDTYLDVIDTEYGVGYKEMLNDTGLASPFDENTMKELAENIAKIVGVNAG